MNVSDDAKVIAAATLVAAIIQGEIAKDKLHIDSDGVRAYVLGHFDATLDVLDEIMPTEEPAKPTRMEML